MIWQSLTCVGSWMDTTGNFRVLRFFGRQAASTKGFRGGRAA